MKAGICIMYIPLAMAKVPTLYHFYGVIILGCQRPTKGEFNSIEGLHIFFLSLPPQISISALPVTMYLLSHYSHLVTFSLL